MYDHYAWHSLLLTAILLEEEKKQQQKGDDQQINLREGRKGQVQDYLSLKAKHMKTIEENLEKLQFCVHAPCLVCPFLFLFSCLLPPFLLYTQTNPHIHMNAFIYISIHQPLFYFVCPCVNHPLFFSLGE